MNSTLLYRISAVLLVLFAAGHTLGFLTFKPHSAEGMAVREAMNSVSFDFRGRLYSYGDFYRGFGLLVTAYLLFSAFLAWYLGNAVARAPGYTVSLAWAFVAVQLVCLVLSVRYFFLVPALLSGIICLCLAWAAWLVRANGA
jgi:hypothetical protein